MGCGGASPERRHAGGNRQLSFRSLTSDVETFPHRYKVLGGFVGKPAGSHVHLTSLAKSQKGEERKGLFKGLHTTMERACAVADNLPQSFSARTFIRGKREANKYDQTCVSLTQ